MTLPIKSCVVLELFSGTLLIGRANQEPWVSRTGPAYWFLEHPRKVLVNPMNPGQIGLAPLSPFPLLPVSLKLHWPEDNGASIQIPGEHVFLVAEANKELENLWMQSISGLQIAKSLSEVRVS